MTDPLSRAFAALADPIRRDIVARLAIADATVNELAEPYEVSLQAVSKHIKVLESAGLVRRSRDGQRRPVHVDAEVFDLMTKWIERYRREAEAKYRRLDAVLAELADEPPMTEESRTDQSTPEQSRTEQSTPAQSAPAQSTPAQNTPAQNRREP